MRKTKLLTLFVLLTVAMGAMAQAGFTVARAAYQGAAGAPSTDWAVGDKLYVYGVSSTTHDQVLMGTLTASSAGAEAFMAGTLSFTETGTEVPMTLTLSNLELPLDYRGTDGSLDNARSYATATVTITDKNAIDADAGTVKLDATPILQLRQALVKVTLQDSEGSPLVPSWLKSDLHNVSGNYSTINLLHQDMPVDGAGDWIFGGATYENGTITLPKEGGCGCGWKPEFWNEDLTQHTGIVVKFDQPINQGCYFCVAYTREGDTEQYYDGNYISQGSTMAWVGVPWDAQKINGVYFSLDWEVSEDVIIKPIDFWFNYPEAYYFEPTSNEFYLPLNGMEVGSNLSFEAIVNGKNYAFSADDVTYTEGSYYEETFKLDETIKLTLTPPSDVNVKVDGIYKYPYMGMVELLPGQTVTLETSWFYRFKSVYAVTPTSDLVVNYKDEKRTASFKMPANDLDVAYTLSRNLDVYVGVTVNGVSNYGMENGWPEYRIPRIPVKKNADGKYALVTPFVFALNDLLLNKDIGDTEYTLQRIMRQDDSNGWTLMNDGDEYLPGLYYAAFTATETSDYVGTCYCDFELFEGYEVTVPAGEYVTYYSDDALYVEDDDAALYTITEVGETEAAVTKLSVAAAGTPLLVQNKSNAEKTILLIPATSQADDVTPYRGFVGSTDATTIGASDDTSDKYAFNGKAFVWVKDAIPVAANKCWMEIPKAMSARTISLVRRSTTGISVMDSEQMTDDNLFDLNGRKVTNPTKKGIYIKNGKKVVVK